MMSDTPGAERPQDDDGRRQAPYPGWTVEPPPQQGWTPPGESGTGWTSPGQPADPEQPEGTQRPRWQPEGSADQRQAGWATGPGWDWPAPTVKPGVIPLRPLGVGEILDGAVTTIRRNPGPMLGLSVIVAIITQLVGLAGNWVILGDIQDLASVPETATASEVFGAMTGLFAATAVILLVSWVATVILTGVLTVVVGRAVLGQHLSTAQAWAMARPRLLRLLLLTLVFALIVAAPLLVATLFTGVVVASGSGPGGGALATLMVLIAIPATIWLYVRYTLATPALMLESTQTAGGVSRAIGIGLALRRSAELVRQSWWRVFGILLLIWLIAFIVGQVVQVPFSIPYLFVDPFDPEAMASLGMLALSALGGVVSTAIVAPFLAAATALLYVDRRIRREGLDIDLARAAGVSIPGRTDQPPPGR